MASRASLAFVILSGILALAIVGQGMMVRDTRRELDEMREKVERLESRQKETTARSGTALDDVREQIARVERKSAEAKPVPAAAPPAGRPGALPTFVSEEDIQKIVDEKVEEKLQARGDARKGAGPIGGDRKMALHDMAKELALDPKVQARVAEVANTAKKEIFEIIKTPRPDGTNVADELIDVMLKGDPAAAQQFLKRLLVEKIPGTQTTYVAGVGAVQDRAREFLSAAMGPDAYGRFEHMNLKPENIETGFDPLGEYFKQRGGK
jgi:hypothetical protein